MLGENSRETIEAVPHPIDFDALDKGSVIQPETLEAIVGCDREHYLYSLRVRALGEQIQSRLEESGLYVEFKQQNGALRILTDEEASRYIKHGADLALSKMRRKNKAMLRVDHSQLSDESRRRHERAQLVMAARVFGADMEGKKALTIPNYESNMPKLFQRYEPEPKIPKQE